MRSCRRQTTVVAFLTLAAVVAPSWGQDPNANDAAAEASAAAAGARPTLLGVAKIWDAAPHNAFTDLIRHGDRWVCAFRESSGHVVKDGRIRVVESFDGATWTSVADLVDPRGDLRDAKLEHLPDGRLVLLTATNLKAGGYRSVVWTTSDLKTWDGPHDVGEPNVWLWGIRFRGDVGLSIGYGTGKDGRYVRVYRTSDARTFTPIVPKLDVAVTYPNENAIAFEGDGTAVVLLRCDPDPAFVGTSKPPYETWSMRQTKTRIGGPALTRTPDGRWLGAGRLFDDGATGKGPRTSLFWVDPKTATIEECLRLPSGGDTSYPGLVWHEGVLHVSYYSSHEGKTSIYLARVRVP